MVHLSADPSTAATWADVRGTNIEATYNVFEAARRQGAHKVVFATTNHVMGFYNLEGAWPIPTDIAIRPDSLYGVSKAFGEALARYYSDAFDMSMMCIRIGWFTPQRPAIAQPARAVDQRARPGPAGRAVPREPAQVRHLQRHLEQQPAALGPADRARRARLRPPGQRHGRDRPGRAQRQAYVEPQAGSCATCVPARRRRAPGGGPRGLSTSATTSSPRRPVLAA